MVTGSSQEGQQPPIPARRMNVPHWSQRWFPRARWPQLPHSQIVTGRLGRGPGMTMAARAWSRRRRQASARQAPEQNLRRPAGVNGCWQTGQGVVTPS